MANVTVRDILGQIEAFHRGLEHLFAGLATTCANERTRMLATHLAQREERLAEALEKYQNDVRNETTLGYWFKAAPMLTEGMNLDGVTLPPDMSTDDLSNFCLAREDALRAFVKIVSEASASPRVQDLFTDLMKQEEREQRMTSRATLEVERDL